MPIRTATIFIAAAIAMLQLASCTGRSPQGDAAADTVPHTKSACLDIEDIEESGEIIAATMWGKDTYYEYRGEATGTAYEMLCDFAAGRGIGVRIETKTDTASLVEALKTGEADIIILPLDEATARKAGLTLCATAKGNGGGTAGWAVDKAQTGLREAIDAWYTPELKQRFEQRGRGTRSVTVKRHVRAPYVSRAKGIISQYDAYFMSGSRHVGWDWKLIAAQCYQESGFDPRAVSWAGARGLMQIMPATAASLGLGNVFDPRENIDAACRYLKRLYDSFGDVRSRTDRIRFTLAAYNGGARHIRDAMNLAQKHGKSPVSYSDVRFFIRNLDKPQYYNDPVVKYGYLTGNETYNYVERIMERWGQYRGGKAVSPISDDATFSPFTPQKSRANRFTRNHTQIVNLKDSI